MLLGPVCKEVLRIMSDPIAGAPMCSGSVGVDFRGGGAFEVACGWAEGDSEVAVPGAGETLSSR